VKHVVVLPLRASAAEIERVKFLIKTAGQLRNATLQTMLGRVDQIRRDPRWRRLGETKKGKERTAAYNELKKRYQVSEFDAIRVAQKHAKDSIWIQDHLDGRAITALGKEVWVPVQSWLYLGAGKPRFQKASERTLLSGNDQRAGLRYKKGYILHSTAAINKALREGLPLGKKLLRIRVDWQQVPKKRRRYYREKEACIKKVSLVIRKDRGREYLEAHLVYDCLPYRSEERVAEAKEVLNKTVAFDLGPSSLAFVAPEGKASGSIRTSNSLKEKITRERQRRKRLERSLDRSRRITNPDAFRKNGTYIPGQKISVRSKNYQGLQEKLRQSYHRERRLVSLWHEEATREITSHGLRLVTEKDAVYSWQEEGFGRSITTLAPAALKARIIHEAKVLREHHGLGEERRELNTYQTSLSQLCLCGRKRKKDLSERKHICRNKDCLLYNTPLDRDLFAAYLGYLVTEGGKDSKAVFSEKRGVKKILNQTYHTQEHRTVATELCSVGSLDRKPGVAQASMGSKEQGQVKTSSRRDLNKDLSKSKGALGIVDTVSKAPLERVEDLDATDRNKTQYAELKKKPSGVLRI